MELPRQTISIGGGKGGVGKSLVAISLAYWLGRLKKRVILMDGDFGGANLHTMLGNRMPEVTLEDFLLRRVENLEEVLQETFMPNVSLLAGGMDIPSLANPNFSRKTRILRAIDKLDTDFLLVDLGAGTNLTALDFFLASPRKIVVLRPQPTSVQNAYGFIKAALYRKISRILWPTPLRGLLDGSGDHPDESIPRSVEEIFEEVSSEIPESLPAITQAVESFHVDIILNMVRDPREKRIAEVIHEVCRQHLQIGSTTLGSIPFDMSCERWATRMNQGTFAQNAQDGALKSAYQIAYNLITQPEARDAAA
ncbi:MAG: P-loop NTPase [Candidatus Eisenbacteria bacterium]|uniref:P-loop NTPase n=1 Tax=Eiseniibacteriota bacterium TaxID=2212470 RepID=A0A948S2I3_UNCEI|nr:P-loop NTPase [Candidatus Eisenbacteria bacterium]